MKHLLRGGFLMLLASLFSLHLHAEKLETEKTDIKSPVYVIPLREDVNRYLGIFLDRSLKAAEKAGAKLVIIEIDTFGGRVDTALEIAGKIGSANWAKTVAYIPADGAGRGVSWSAGALMAFSCSELWMAPGTSMGAAAPVLQSAEGMQPAGEKAVSAVRGQMAALAEKNGYPVDPAVAMVDADMVLLEILTPDGPSLVSSQGVERIKQSGKSVKVVETVNEEGKLLTLTAGQMERYGISSGTVSSREELIEKLGFSPENTVVVEKSVPDSLLTILTSGVATSLFLIIAIVALYLEITSPGFGVPGVISLISFTVVFSLGGLMGTLGSVEILLFLLGMALLLLEIFIIPGFGIAGIAGILLIGSSLLFSFQDFYWPQFDWQWGLVRRNLAVIGTGFLGAVIVIGALIVLLPRSGLFSRLVLQPSGGAESSGNILDDSMIGREGTAITDLRPVGKITVNQKIFTARTQGEYLDKNSPVVIIESGGVGIVVEQKTDERKNPPN